MTITLPDGIVERIEALAKRLGFSAGTELLIRLIEDAEMDGAFAEMYRPPELSPKNRAELETMLEAGMNSGPPIRVTSEFWEGMRRQVKERTSSHPLTPPDS